MGHKDLQKLATRNSRSARNSRPTQQSGQQDPSQEFEFSLIQDPPAVVSLAAHSTPIKSSSHAQQPPLTVEDMRPSIASELAGSISDNSTSAENLYSSYNDYPIANFLKHCEHYDSETKEWKQVKSKTRVKPFKENVLYEPLCTIIQDILIKCSKNKSAFVEETHKKKLAHVEDGVIYYRPLENGDLKAITNKSSPDLSIMGQGLDFCPTAKRSADAQYVHCISPMEVKTESTHDQIDVLNQVAIYARQCFIQQAHRRYVPTVVLTETHAMLHVYDRSGVLRPKIKVNYHTDPVTFVRIILGISSIKGKLESSPFDPRISWEKEGGYPVIKVAKPVDNNEAQARALRSSTKSKFDCYEVTGRPWNRRSIRGRGTVCWRALKVDDSKPRTEWIPVLLKDSWRSSGRQNEWELLNEVKGLAGVGQMIAYEDDTEQPVSVFRNHVVEGLYDGDKNPYKSDRIFCRIVLEAYGKSIKRFQTKLQLLHALYDAVAGHKRMWMETKILHRDISVENILLGKQDAETGNRGILIDLDMAIKVDRETNLSGGQFRTGTRAYQSVAVLSSAHWANLPSKSPPHDHLDDLESFFYVLAWIYIKYERPGKAISVPALDRWEKDDVDECADAKFRYLYYPMRGVQPYFAEDKIMSTLLVSLAALCIRHLMRKQAHATGVAEEFPNLMTVYNASSGKDHDDFLEIIQTAITALELRDPEKPYSPATDTASVAGPSDETADGPSEPKTPQKNRGSDNKRKTQESSQDEPVERKRTRGSQQESTSARPQVPLSRTRSQTRASTSKK